MAKVIMDWIGIFIVLFPVAVRIAGYVAAKSHNQKLTNLVERSRIIVEGLEQTYMSGDEKKKLAMQKLSNYASEVGIKISEDQIDDYIESAVRFVKIVTGNNDTPKLN